MNLLPAQGFIRTDSLSGTTDSAAAGTALATGRKTRNGVVAMSPSLSENFVSIAEIARRKGMKTGIVTSVFLQDATPAAFYGHAKTRSEHYSLGKQSVESGYEYFAGGGFINPKGKNKKSRDLYEMASSEGYAVARDLKTFPASGKVLALHPGASNGYMPWVIDERGGPSLADFTDYGIKLLDGPNGFFMMVEGGKIDLACHANDAATTVREVIAFDEAVLRAVEFMNSRPESTLIVVTSDHETGGMAVGENNAAIYETLSSQRGSYSAFERSVSPKEGASFADYAALAEKFFGLGATASPELEKTLRLSAMDIKRRKTAVADYNKLYATYDPFTLACLKAANARAGITWATFWHTGEKTPVSAAGVGAEAFAGEYDNTGIYHRIRLAIDDAR
jgi:alkaline phosphatase